jgi:hypothetical protein
VGGARVSGKMTCECEKYSEGGGCTSGRRPDRN